MRIALAQYALCPEMSANIATALRFMTQAAAAGADLILYPELCISPFFPQFSKDDKGDALRYAVPPEGDYIRQFQERCRQLNLCASPNIYMHEGEHFFDASLVINAGGATLGVSKMVHIAQLPQFYEQDYYTPSDTGFLVHDLPFGKIGIVVCFDRHFPESIRTCALRGASLILIPTANIMSEPRDLFECELRAAAMQNGVYIAMCNRVGPEGGVVFCGESIVVDPDGRVVVKASTEETLLLADIDLSQVPAARTKRPYLILRRPDMYA